MDDNTLTLLRLVCLFHSLEVILVAAQVYMPEVVALQYFKINLVVEARENVAR